MPCFYVGLHGKKGAGKDTAARFLAAQLHHPLIRIVSFAHALRRAVEKVSGGVIKAVDTRTEEDKARKVPLNIKWDVEAAFGKCTDTIRTRALEVLHNATHGTVGRLLQVVGTEIGRDLFSTNYWVERLDRELLKFEADVVIFTDVRFPNEYDYIRSKPHHLLVSIRRPLPASATDGRSTSHPSETALDHITALGWHVILENSGTLTEFADQVRVLVVERIPMASSTSSAEKERES